MGETLDRLREILPLLQAAPPDGSGEFVTYDVEVGYACTRNLYVSSSVAVCNAEMTAGTIFPVHYHDAVEFFIVHVGSLVVYADGERTDMGVGDVITLPSKVAHSVHSPVDAQFLAVSIPPAEGYPGVHRKSLDG